MVIGVLNKNRFTLNRVDVGSKLFSTSAHGIQPQLLKTGNERSGESHGQADHINK
jgi:hypothetical protein